VSILRSIISDSGVNVILAVTINGFARLIEKHRQQDFDLLNVLL
jgi:hypothetical protein